MPRQRRTLRTGLPNALRCFFWDTDFARVSWEENFGYIVYRLLEHGTPKVIEWLRDEIGDAAICNEIAARKARGLAYDRVGRWIPRAVYDTWAADRPPSIWEHR